MYIYKLYTLRRIFGGIGEKSMEINWEIKIRNIYKYRSGRF